MSTTTAPTETVGFTTVAPTKEECVKKAFGKAMKKYDPPTPPAGGPSRWGPPGSGGPPGGGGPQGGGGPPAGGGPPGAGGSPGGAGQPAAPNLDVRPHGTPPATFHGGST